MNVHTITGNLGTDPKHQPLSNGNSVTELSIATTEYWRDKEGERQEKTTWHKVKAFGKVAEVLATNLKKGSAISVSGPHLVDVVEKEDGSGKQYYHYTRVRDFSFHGGASKKEEVSVPQQPAAPVPNEAPQFNQNEEVPF